MNKKQSIKLSIPQPCHENWDKMTPNERGRHCASCNKTVIDFSLYTDRQLVEFFAGLSGSVCGRVHKYQANRVMAVTEQPKRSLFYKLFFGATLASCFGVVSGNAQTTVRGDKMVRYPDLKPIDPLKQRNETAKTDTGSYIEGTVFKGTENNPVPFVIVSVKEYPVQIIPVATDVMGKFKLYVPAEFKGRKLTLEFKPASRFAYGIYETEREVDLDAIPLRNFKVDMEEYMLGGMIGVMITDEIDETTTITNGIPAQYEGDGGAPLPPPSIIRPRY